MPTVVVKTGGTHQFGSPGEASEFLDLFLEKAGFIKEFRWEARLEKTAHCSWDSPPVRVVGYKHWVIYLRVKPSINATVDHFVSLLIPDGSGYGAETVYRQMKGLVKSFNRFVRTAGHRKKIMEPAMDREAIPTIPSPAPSPPEIGEFAANGLPAEGDNHTLDAAPLNGEALNGDAAPAEAAEAEPTPVFDSLAGVTRHPEKLRYVLTHIDRVSTLGLRDALTFKKTLRRECGWTNHPLRATSLILAWLVKHGYVEKILDENEVVTNYALTMRGQACIAVGPQTESAGTAQRPAPKPAAPRPEPVIDTGALLIRFREKAQELADAGGRLEANRNKYRELQLQIKQLDDEYQEIAKLLLANREASVLLARLLEIQGSVPIKT